MGVSPTSSEVPSHFPGRGGAAPPRAAWRSRIDAELFPEEQAQAPYPALRSQAPFLNQTIGAGKNFAATTLAIQPFTGWIVLDGHGGGCPSHQFLMRAAQGGVPDWARMAKWVRRSPEIVLANHEAKSSLRLLTVFGPRCLMDSEDDPSTCPARRIATRQGDSAGYERDWRRLRDWGFEGDRSALAKPRDPAPLCRERSD